MSPWFARRTGWNLEPNRLSVLLQKLKAEGPVLDLTESNPTVCGLQYQGDAILAALAHPAALLYEAAPRGLVGAREAVVAYYRERGSQVDRETIFICVSTSEAYSFALRLLCDPGDEVLVPAPSYPLLDILADLLDVKLIPYSLFYDQGWQIDLHSVRAAFGARTRAIILIHPNNPTGSYVKPGEREELNRLCLDHHLALIADEVFLDYSLSTETPPSFAGNSGALTFTLSGLSKIAALPQMKAAWLAVSGPEELTTPALARLEVIADTYLSPNAPVQHALPTLLDQRHSVQPQLRRRVLRNLEELDRQLAGRTSCERLQVEGGWCAVLRVPATRTDEEFALELLERFRVLVHPGHFYNFPRDGYLVLSLIVLPEVFAEGLRHLLTVADG